MSFNKEKYGSIRKVSGSSYLWHIPQLIDIIVEWNGYDISSPRFMFGECPWRIRSRKRQTKSGAVSSLCLQNCSDFGRTQIYRVRVIDIDGDNYRPLPVIKDTFPPYKCGTLQDQPESDLLKHASRRAPGGDLSVHLEFYRERDILPAVAIIPAKSTPSTADCGTQTSPNRVHQERTVSSDSDDIENLGQNFKDLLLCGRKSDVTLVVNGRELKAHQTILVARSPVFSAMLNEEWLEQASGAVQITDCDAEVFQDFLLYLYSGKVETLDVRNVVELFTIADKYDVKSLAKHCVDFMIRNLTVDYFCDFVTLALRHCELKFMESANKFLAENVKQIIATEKWRVFTAQNPNVASELLVKDLCP